MQNYCTVFLLLTFIFVVSIPYVQRDNPSIESNPSALDSEENSEENKDELTLIADKYVSVNMDLTLSNADRRDGILELADQCEELMNFYYEEIGRMIELNLKELQEFGMPLYDVEGKENLEESKKMGRTCESK